MWPEFPHWRRIDNINVHQAYTIELVIKISKLDLYAINWAVLRNIPALNRLYNLDSNPVGQHRYGILGNQATLLQLEN